MKNTVKCLTAAVLSALLLALSGCGDERDILESSKDEKTVVMTIDGFDVPMELYRYVALNYKESFEAGQSSDFWLGESGQEQLTKLNENVDKSLIKLYTTLSLCRDYGIEADSAYVKDAVNSSMNAIYESYEDDYEVYAQYINSYNMNDGVYRFIVRNDILAEELIYKMTELGEIPSDEAELLSIINSDEFIRVKQILIPNDNGKTSEENHETAQEAYNRAMAGESFETLINEYGGDLFMFNNPDGYYIAKGSYHRNFEEAAFSLDIGEISGIVETDAGYSIIKRYEKESDYINKHFDDLAEGYIDGKYNLALEAREAELTVEATDKLADYSIFNLTLESEE